MKLCGPHHGLLVDALTLRDLWRLVDPARGQERGERWISGDMRDAGDFDPYVVCWMEFNARAVDFLPPGYSREHPEDCPICETERFTGRALANLWVERYADLVLQLAVLMGVAKAPRSGRFFVQEGALRH